MVIFKLAVLYVEYYPERFPKAFEKLQSYLKKIDYTEITYFRINNRDKIGSDVQKQKDIYYVKGNNREREFSGWQRGLDFIMKSNYRYDIVLFVNEAFEASGPSYLIDHAGIKILLKSFYLNSVIGRIDTHFKETTLLGYNIRSWICTNCFFVPFRAIEKIQNIISIDTIGLNQFMDEKFPVSGDFLKEDSPMNKIFKVFIVDWLTNSWHSKFVPDEKSWELFRQKTKAIFNEVLLTARFREMKISVVSYYLGFSEIVFGKYKFLNFIRRVINRIIRLFKYYNRLFIGR
jgi:hypothetical protein